MAYAMFGKPSQVYDLGGRKYVADTTGKIADVSDMNDCSRLRDAGCLDKNPIIAASSADNIGAVLTVAGRTGDVVLSHSDVSGLGSAALVATTAFDAAGAATTAQANAIAGATAIIAAAAKHALIAGGAAGNLTVAGIKTTDTLNMVLQFVGAATTVTTVADLTSEFTISASNTINNTAGTATTGDKLLVLWTATT